MTGIDLVKLQLTTALEGQLPFSQSQIRFHGHAIECRINAEDPDPDFLPQPGTMERLHWPGGFGVRVDNHVLPGYTVPMYCDSLLAKIIANGPTRAAAIRTMARALDEFDIGPNAPPPGLLRGVLDHQRFRAGDYTLDLGPTLVPEVEDV